RARGACARALMTADVEINTTTDFAPGDLAKIEEIVGRSGIVEARNETITTALMARPMTPGNNNVKFVELKGIEPPFPLVGHFETSDGKPFDFDLLKDDGAVVARILLEDMDLKIGDQIKIGDGVFTIRSTFDEEPGGSSGFRLGARVFIEKKAFDDAG